MEIEVSTSGGLTAGMRYGRTPQVLRTDQLDPGDTRALTELVERARAAAEPEPTPVGCDDDAGVTGLGTGPTGAASPPRRMPDAMSYTITVRDGSQAAVLKESDTDMTDEFAALLDWVQGRLADH